MLKISLINIHGLHIQYVARKTLLQRVGIIIHKAPGGSNAIERSYNEPVACICIVLQCFQNNENNISVAGYERWAVDRQGQTRRLLSGSFFSVLRENLDAVGFQQWYEPYDDDMMMRIACLTWPHPWISDWLLCHACRDSPLIGLSLVNADHSLSHLWPLAVNPAYTHSQTLLVPGCVVPSSCICPPHSLQWVHRQSIRPLHLVTTQPLNTKLIKLLFRPMKSSQVAQGVRRRPGKLNVPRFESCWFKTLVWHQVCP